VKVLKQLSKFGVAKIVEPEYVVPKAIELTK